MITNIDQNLKRLEDRLQKLGLAENTIVIYMTDNGTAAGYAEKDGQIYGYNAGLRGTKGSEYEGGHRVLFAIRWPGGGIEGNKEINQLLAHIDLLPTLVDLAGLTWVESNEIDGKSFAPLLREETKQWENRTLIVDSQRTLNLVKWRKSAVMDDTWRLVNGQELYNITEDVGQTNDVAAEHPEVVARLRESYNAYHVAPICMPRRTSVMTGHYLSTHGSGFDRPTNYIITEDEFKTSYPVLLRNHGYFTGFIGKFGFAVGEGEKVKNNNYQDKSEYMPAHHFNIWNGFPGQGSYFPKQGTFNGYENRWNASHLTEFMGYQAIEFFQKAKDSGKPFCLSISFKAPHAPFHPAKEFREKYNDRVIPRMVNDEPEYYAKLPKVVKEKSRNARWYFGRTEDYYGQKIDYRHDWHIEVDSIYQKYIKNYYALISGIDHTVGRLRAELKQLDLDQNTIIIYTSDNGFFAGSKQLMGKALLYEESDQRPEIAKKLLQEAQLFYQGLEANRRPIGKIDEN